jgi:hypothetical protein
VDESPPPCFILFAVAFFSIRVFRLASDFRDELNDELKDEMEQEGAAELSDSVDLVNDVMLGAFETELRPVLVRLGGISLF